MKINIIEKYNAPFEYIGAFMQLLLAYQFYMLWANPVATDLTKITDFIALIAFEFVMVHSGVMMAVMPKKVSIFFLIPVYGVFAFVMNFLVSDNAILVLYGLVVFNRMRFAFSDVSQGIKSRAISNSTIAVVMYFVLLFVSASYLEYIPVLGLTKSFLTETLYFENLNIRGLFFDEPQMSMALGVVYYIVMAFISVLISTKTTTN